MENVLRKVRLAAALLALAGIASLTYSAFHPVMAKAQSFPIAARIFKSAGPIALNHNESALIGLLLPAVQRTAEPFRLRLFDSAGGLLVEIPVAEAGDGSVRTAFFDVFFGDGSVRVTDHATGKVLAEQKSDGVFSAVLLPAVQRNGFRVGAISASVQIFDTDKIRKQIVGMCDGSV